MPQNKTQGIMLKSCTAIKKERDTQPDEQPDERPEVQTEEQPAEQPAEQPEEQTEEQPQHQGISNRLLDPFIGAQMMLLIKRTALQPHFFRAGKSIGRGPPHFSSYGR